MKKIISILFVLGVSALVFLRVKEPSTFNMIAYTFFLLLSKPGEGGESTFIRVFDVLFSLGIGVLSYKIIMFFIREWAK